MSQGKATQNGPYRVELEEGKSYFWCACGLSAKQPFCDGSHKSTEWPFVVAAPVVSCRCVMVHTAALKIRAKGNSNVPLLNKTHWIFDMDGTLTHAIHDFEAIREELGLPRGRPILESLAALPPEEESRLHKQLDELEYRIAEEATAQPGAEALLTSLQEAGATLGILTRNGKGIAYATLDACGLRRFFKDDDVISRNCCTPKPDGAGVSLLLDRWQASTDQAVMVGDYLFDLEAGRNAGVTTVHLDVNGEFAWPDMTDVGVKNLNQLIEMKAGTGSTSPHLEST